ncbi:MAG TPA: hypothetical protein VKF81_17250, partial [Blastocatellia bacterium]|nr:hypothetical protein [Blastocatellia bacterium]
DRGYAAEYFGSANTLTSQAELELPADGQQSITTVMKAPDLAQLEASPAPDAAAIDDDFSSRPTAERPAFDDVAAEPARPPEKRRGYAMIIIVALISLLLLGATGFFVYSVYLKRTPPPPPTEPAAQQQ